MVGAGVKGLADLRHHLMAGVIERIARSPERDAFVLRGGMLTRAWVGTRPTRDLDFVGDFTFDADTTRQRFARALAIEVSDDIRIGELAATPIWTDTAFPGVRLELALHYSGVDQMISVDVGFNDPLVPAPVMFAFAGTTATVDVRAIRPETQLAWKLHALAEMGTSWRPKDLYDAWLITTKLDLDAAALGPAIVAAFESRDYARASAIGVLAAPHWATKTSRLRWERPQPLADIVAEVRARLAPTFATLPDWKGTR
jgi:hypothetical protein